MNWHKVEFKKLVRLGILEVGDGYRAKNEELGGNGLIFLRAAYLRDNGFVLSNPDRFKENMPERFGSKIAQINDTIITTKGNSIGRVERINNEWAGSVYSPHISYWRLKNQTKIDQTFLFYWSQGSEFQTQLAGMSASTDMAPYLSLRDQLQLCITLPDIISQRAIAAVLVIAQPNPSAGSD